METTANSSDLDRRPLVKCLGNWLYDERVLLVRLGVAALVATALTLAVPHVSRIVFDTALPNASPRLMFVVALSVLFLAAHSAWLSWVQAKMAIELGTILERKALARCVKAMIHCSPEQRKQKNAGWMMTTLGGAGDAAARYSSGYVSLLTQGALGIGYLVSLASYSPTATLVVVGFKLATTLLALSLVKFESGHVRTLLERSSEQQQGLQLLLGQLASLRGLFATERMARRWSHQVGKMAEAQERSGKIGVLINTVEGVGAKTLSTGLMLWAVYKCFGQELTLGEMMFLMMTSAGLASTLSGLISVYLGFRSLAPYVGRVDELTKAAKPVTSSKQAAVTTSEKIVINRASFRYSDKGRWILREHTWELRRGDVVHLRSPSGSGKSTMLKLMAGILKPSAGSVSVFGLDASEANDLVLYVPQSCELFETSIRENLELFSSASWENICQVASLTGLDRMLRQLPMGDQTLVSAQGQNLSSGQRQLILLTAAFASSRPVLLLDESTSQIDSEMKSLCQWEQLTRGRTVVRVEHA